MKSPTPPKRTQKDRLQEILDDIGGEPLEGSGFEDETPEEEFKEE